MRTWLITGASSGLGREYVRAALDAGDRVVAFSRSGVEAASDRLVDLRVDVTDRSAVFAAVATLDRVDVLVNNAGTMAYGFVEEFTEQQARDALETNFFGALWVNQAVMPLLREQRSGHIVQISSIGGVGGFAGTGLYSASKFALEGLSEALAVEAAQFGVKLTIVEPGGYWTDLYNRMAMTEPNADYDGLREQLAKQNAEGSIDSDPALAAEALMQLVNSDDPPLRLLLGSAMLDVAIGIAEKRVETWRSWESVSRSAEKAIEQSEVRQS
jgi:NAD(P)-dependent dehydrogenase (short-subunit alcohol dehydrogenase family)